MKRLLACLALVLACAWAYAPLRQNGFVHYDDGKYITENTVVQEGLTAEGLAWAFTNRRTANFHPLTWLSHMLDVELFGLDPVAHHLANLAWHAATACALLCALLSLGLRLGAAFGVALLFAVHPLRVESVAWAAERKDVLSGFFFMLVLWGWSAWVQRPSAWRYGLVLLWLVLGLSAKAMLVTAPFVLLLLDRWPLRRSAYGWKQGLLEKLPLLLVALLFVLITYSTQTEVGAVRSSADIPPAAAVANALRGYGFYLWKSVAPTSLAVFYPHPAIVQPQASAWDAGAWSGLLALVVGSLLAWRLRRAWPGVLTGWLWFLGMLVPVLGLVQVGEQAFADRYAYLPTIGLYLALVPPLWTLAGSLGAGRPTATVALAIAALWLGLGTREQVRVWRDSETLFRHALSVTEANHVAEFSLAIALEERGELLQASAAYERSLQANPAFDQAHNNLGVLLQRLGRRAEGRSHLEQALALQPRSALALNNLGIWYARDGQPAKALELFTRAVEEQPTNHEAHRNRGGVLERLGRLPEALEAFERSLELSGPDARTYEDCARIHQTLGHFEPAIELYSKALAHAPEGSLPLGAANNLAWILATHPRQELRDGAKALQLARGCVQATAEEDPRMLATLAASLAETGAFAEAERWQRLALERAQPSARPELRAQLERYRSERPWRTDG